MVLSGGQMDSLAKYWTNVMANNGNLSIRQKLLLPRKWHFNLRAPRHQSASRQDDIMDLLTITDPEQHESQHLVVQSSCRQD